MRVQATKKMANELNKALKGTRFDGLMEFSATQVDADVYWIGVTSDLSRADYDFDGRTGKYRVITVRYPAGYYAYPQNVTGYDLVQIFKRTGNNWDDFAKEVFEQYEI